MKTEYKYIHFKKKKDKPKTSSWFCLNTSHNFVLGIIEWFPPWRQYCFFPSYDTVFNKQCFEDIINFIDQLEMQRLKNKKR